MLVGGTFMDVVKKRHYPKDSEHQAKKNTRNSILGDLE
jgi:hypothetical protein